MARPAFDPQAARKVAVRILRECAGVDGQGDASPRVEDAAAIARYVQQTYAITLNHDSREAYARQQRMQSALNVVTAIDERLAAATRPAN